MIARRTAVTNDLLANDGYIQKVDAIGDPLQKIEVVVDFSALAQVVEKIAPRPEQPKGGRPPYPTEVMVRVLVVKRLHGL
ncbi:transposase, partial [Acidithiobacillus caldus]|nr:transposase [Acidithiobacillus caldus]